MNGRGEHRATRLDFDKNFELSRLGAGSRELHEVVGADDPQYKAHLMLENVPVAYGSSHVIGRLNLVGVLDQKHDELFCATSQKQSLDENSHLLRRVQVSLFCLLPLSPRVLRK